MWGKSNNVIGTHGLKVEITIVSSFGNYDMIVFPGGMNGVKNLSEMCLFKKLWLIYVV